MRRVSFNKITTKEQAYIIGFLFGDGYISIKNDVRLDIAIKDKEIAKEISNYFSNSTYKEDLRFNKKQKKFPKAIVSFRDRLFGKELIKLYGGRVKVEKRFPIISKHLEPYFVLGFFDADGTITWGYRKDRNRLWQKVSFTSPRNMLYGLQQVLLKQGISTIIRPKSNENVDIIEFANEFDVYKFYKYLPKDSIFLKRKDNKFKEWLQAITQKYTINKGDIVKFADKRTLDKYNIKYDKYLKGYFIISDKGIKVNSLLLTKKGISNYALRLELDENGGTQLFIDNTVPSSISV